MNSSSRCLGLRAYSIPNLRRHCRNGFVTDHDAPLCQKIFHISEAQAKSVVKPNGMADNFMGKSILGMGDHAANCLTKRGLKLSENEHILHEVQSKSAKFCRSCVLICAQTCWSLGQKQSFVGIVRDSDSIVSGSFSATDYHLGIPDHRIRSVFSGMLQNKSHSIPSFNRNVFQPVRNLL
jgi:hypothetical protein